MIGYMFYLNFIAANELFLQKDPNAFFPPISTSQTKKPYSSLVNNYHKKVERCRITLEENDERMSASSPKSQEHRQTCIYNQLIHISTEIWNS